MNQNTTSNLVFNLFHYPSSPTTWFTPSYKCHAQAFAEFEVARDTIEHLAFPEANWDGYGAVGISKETKDNALAALQTLEATVSAPAIIPNPNGTLSFEWETEQGIGHLEIGRTRYSFYVRPNLGNTILLDGSAVQVKRFLGSVVEEMLYPKPPQPATANISAASHV